MTDQQDWPVRAASVQARHHVPLSGVRPENLHVALGKSGVAQALGHRFCGDRRAADRIGGVDLDELPEDVVGKLFGRVIDLRAHAKAAAQKNAAIGSDRLRFIVPRGARVKPTRRIGLSSSGRRATRNGLGGRAADCNVYD